MAAVVITPNSTRIDAVGTGSTLTSIGGGAGAGTEPDILYQGSGGTPADVSRKVGTSPAGFFVTSAATHNISTGSGTYQTLLLKCAVGNWAALELLSVPGVELRAGSSTNDYYIYDVSGVDVYPEKGGFVFFAIDPNITGYRDGTAGTPVLTAADVFGIVGDFTATSKSENVVLSAIDVGDGLTLTGGTTPDNAGVFQDYADYNSILANRQGFAYNLDGVPNLIGVYGTLSIGDGSTASRLTDNNAGTLVFFDGRFAAGWSGVSIDSTTTTTTTGWTYRSEGTAGGSTDTRSIFTVVSAWDSTNETIRNFASIEFQNATSSFNGAIEDSGLITAFGSNLSGAAVRRSTAASALSWNVATDTNGKLDDMTFVSVATGHAIELGPNTPSTITLIGHDYGSAYASTDGSTGNEVLYNNSGKSITVNYSGDAPTVRNGAGASTTLVNSISWTLQVKDAEGNAVTGCEITVTDGATTPVELFHVESSVTGTEVYSFNGTNAGNNATILIIKSGAGSTEPFSLDTTHPNAATTTTLQLIDDRVESNP